MPKKLNPPSEKSQRPPITTSKVKIVRFNFATGLSCCAARHEFNAANLVSLASTDRKLFAFPLISFFARHFRTRTARTAKQTAKDSADDSASAHLIPDSLASTTTTLQRFPAFPKPVEDLRIITSRCGLHADYAYRERNAAALHVPFPGDAFDARLTS